jgi:hypothetical protein
MKKILYVVAGTALLALTGCGVIPGTGMYAGELVNRYLNTKFTDPVDPQRHPSSRGVYGYGNGWLYRTEREGPGTRYYIRFDYERCKYSLYVDENDIIRSWRDEGGNSHMNRCLVR